ncbi:MAG: orotidine-5'-phosphate decarboxylase [Bacteroidetes bacterium]|nr:orotidine-5'-phosphate decarboxylase [Bacteroidota bacterium]
MIKQKLTDHIKAKKSFLCVGLDSDLNKIPLSFKRAQNPILAFNKAIIDATAEHCVSYKINTAFYESMGVAGWQTMQETLDYIPSTHFTIADAKRGDIGNTANQYAKTFLETVPFDSVTVSPYMGIDTIEPYWQFENKIAIVLGLTSNPGANDFEQLELKNGNRLFEEVIGAIAANSTDNNTMFVVGATQEQDLENIRKIAPNHFFLVPGVGAQGGSLSAVYNKAANKDVGLLVNVSRGIIYSGNNAQNFERAIKESAEAYHNEMIELMQDV